MNDFTTLFADVEESIPHALSCLAAYTLMVGLNEQMFDLKGVRLEWSAGGKCDCELAVINLSTHMGTDLPQIEMDT